MLTSWYTLNEINGEYILISHFKEPYPCHLYC